MFKRMQHVGPTSSNIVVSNMLGPFEHHVGYCCIMLDVGSSLILFKLFIQHRPTFGEKSVQRHRFHCWSNNVGQCCIRLNRPLPC